MTGASGEAALVAAAPLLAAALLAFVPARIGGWLGFGAALAALALAVRLAVAGSAGALGTVLGLLVAFVGATAAWPAARGAAPDSRQIRAEAALFQAALGGALLATLADDLAVGWIGLAIGAVAATVAAAAWRAIAVCGVALVLALLGIVVLGAAALPALGPGGSGSSWDGLARAAPAMQPAAVGLALPFLVAGWGTLAALAPLHSWLLDVQARGPVATRILSLLLADAALANLLRLRQVAAACPGLLAPGWILVMLGLISALGGALLLWRQRDARRFLAVSTVQQGGLAAVAFGLGGAAVFAGLLHLVLHTLAKAALLQAGEEARDGLWRTDRARAWLVLAAGAAVAGLPPAGVFASEFLVLAEAMRQAPGVAILAGLGVVVAAWAVLARMRAWLLGATMPGAAQRDRGALPGAWMNLALALVLALAMPAPVVALLRAAAR